MAGEIAASSVTASRTDRNNHHVASTTREFPRFAAPRLVLHRSPPRNAYLSAASEARGHFSATTSSITDQDLLYRKSEFDALFGLTEPWSGPISAVKQAIGKHHARS